MIPDLKSFERGVLWLVLMVILVLTTLAFFAGRADAQTLTFTVATARATETATPRLTWVVSPAATSCTASGDWSGAKSASGGTETLASINASRTYNLSCEWVGSNSATLSWDPVTAWTNGEPIANTDLVRFTVARSTSASDVLVANNPPASVTITNHNVGTSAVISNISPSGNYFFCVRAVSVGGVASDCGKQTNGAYPAKTIVAGAQQSRSLSVTIDPKPQLPANVSVQ